MDEVFKVLAANGVSGAVLGYILWKLIPTMQAVADKLSLRLYRLEEAMNSSTKGEMLRLAASPHVSDAVKHLAADLIIEVEKHEANSLREQPGAKP